MIFWIWSLILRLWEGPSKDLVAEKSTYQPPVRIGRIKTLLTSELDACEDLLDQITALLATLIRKQSRKLIEGLRIDG